jgi:hypothetical protein
MAEDWDGFGAGGRHGLLDQSFIQPSVGEDIVERFHHLVLGHDRQALEVSQLEPNGFEIAQPPAMKW